MTKQEAIKKLEKYGFAYEKEICNATVYYKTYGEKNCYKPYVAANIFLTFDRETGNIEELSCVVKVENYINLDNDMLLNIVNALTETQLEYIRFKKEIEDE